MTICDPQTKEVKVSACKLISKILKGNKEIIPTRLKKPAASKPVAAVKAVGVHIGAHDYHGGGILSQSLVFGRIAATQVANYIKK